ncbi:MAG: hypothetical protein K9M15_00660 [Candidatus Marinimicrobia bacterium]|nr:hypothetical protein [Candidatus Neomarinimicrobiota bacterium]
MNWGMILNTATCLVVAIAAIIASKKIYSKKISSAGTVAFALFWFIAGWQWFFSGARTFFAFLDMNSTDEFIFYIVEILVGIYMIPLAHFVITKAINNTKINKIFTALYSILAIIYVYLLLNNGVSFVSKTFFASEYKPNEGSLLLFQIMFVLIFIILIFNIIKQIIAKIRNTGFDKNTLYSFLSIFIYSIVGYFDQVGEPSGWKLILIRTVLAGTACIACISYYKPEEKEKNDNLVV